MTETPATQVDVQEVRLRCGGDELQAVLSVPAPARGVVLFAHGSGSGRHSSRNRQVAQSLNRAGLATLLLDLLTQQEESVDRFTAQHRFDIPMLTRRFEDATTWTGSQASLRGLPVGYFGASTGSAVALRAAARFSREVAAVVSRGGRPDLAGPDALAAVRAPTLLIVGGADTPVIGLNRGALDQLRCDKELAIVPGASHLFEEPGALEEVSRLAGDWFQRHLVPSGATR